MTSSRLKRVVVSMIIFIVPLTCFSQAVQMGKVRGVVTDYFGNPLEDVEINFYLLENQNRMIPPTRTLVKSVRSDVQGHYIVTTLPPGHYEASALLPGFPVSRIAGVVICPGLEVELGFGLRIGITHGLETIHVFGRINDDKGNPLRRAIVILISEFDRTQNLESVTDKNGRYSFKFVQPGRYIVFASFSSSRFSSEPFVVDNRLGQKVKAEINLQLRSKTQ
jgi:hypothetical protein